MKGLLIIFLLVFQAAMGQNLSTAVFKECKYAYDPYKCTDEKLQDDITHLISEKIIADINKNGIIDHFFVSFAFLSDKNGQVIPETIEISCENAIFKDAIKTYIANLPNLVPKNTMDTEKRSVHIKTYTLIFDQAENKFHIASLEEINSKNLKPDFSVVASPPIYKGCESESNAESMECTSKKIGRIVTRKFNKRKLKGTPRTIKMFASFIVEKDGSLKISEIICSEDNEELKEEYRRVLEKLRDFKPGHFKDIPIRASYKLPITLTVR